MEEKKEQKITIKLPKINVWILVSLILAVVLILSLLRGWSVTGKVTGTLSAQEVAQKAVEWISNYFQSIGQDIDVTLLNVSETENGIYQFTVKMLSDQVESTETYYITKDGKLFLPQVIDITQQLSTQEEMSKKDKPTVELYVMSFCPYGVQAENIMKPVVDLLGNKIDVKIRFIVNVGGTTIESVSSLHGLYEAKEDARQLAIMQLYPGKYWQYLSEFNTKVYSVVSSEASKCYSSSNTTSCFDQLDKNVLDPKWKEVANSLGMDTKKIEEIAYGNEGINLLKQEEQSSESNGVSGSPTLIINGVSYNGARNSEAYKQAICNGFTTQPKECSQTLNSTGTTSSGGC